MSPLGLRISSTVAMGALAGALLLALLQLSGVITPGGAAHAATVLPRGGTEAHAAFVLAEDPTLPASDGHAPAALGVGTTAIVRADGDCLRLRAAPGLAGERISCLREGSSVVVLEGNIELDGHEWQRVDAAGAVGWVAAEFLAESSGAPSCAAAGRSVSRAGLSGQLSTGGGIALAVWGGGTAQGVATAAAANGCELRSIWASKPGGGFAGYLYGAPDFVNEAWFELFPTGRVPAGTPLITICGTPGAGGGQSRIAAPALPVPSGRAPVETSSVPAPTVSAAGAVVIDHDSGAVLYEQNGHLPLAPASLTKIATAILAIEGSDLDSWADVDVDSRAMPGSSLMGLRPGDCFQVRDLAYGLMLPSGNDAALAIGRYVAGSDAAFVEQMNMLTARLGLHESTFIDPHGLGGPGHLTSAYDIAMLARYGMTLPEFKTIVGAAGWTAVGSRTIPMRNVNRFLGSYAGADGVKTGFTEEAGRTLAASATRDGHRVYVVLLNAPDRFDDAERLLDWVFNEFAWS